MLGGAALMHLTRLAEVEKQSVIHDTKCQGHEDACIKSVCSYSETALVLVPVLCAEQLCAELHWGAVAQ